MHLRRCAFVMLAHACCARSFVRSCMRLARVSVHIAAQDWATADDEFALELQAEAPAPLEWVVITGRGTATERLTRFQRGVPKLCGPIARRI
jgi:hypothetical protein